MSLRLPLSLESWNTPAFAKIFCREVAQLPHGTLPLQQAMLHGSYVVDRSPTVVLLSTTEVNRLIKVKAGVFFHSVIAGCNCADDPTPMEEQNEHCELLFHIDRDTGTTRIETI